MELYWLGAEAKGLCVTLSVIVWAASKNSRFYRKQKGTLNSSVFALGFYLYTSWKAVNVTGRSGNLKSREGLYIVPWLIRMMCTGKLERAQAINKDLCNWETCCKCKETLCVQEPIRKWQVLSRGKWFYAHTQIYQQRVESLLNGWMSKVKSQKPQESKLRTQQKDKQKWDSRAIPVPNLGTEAKVEMIPDWWRTS